MRRGGRLIAVLAIAVIVCCGLIVRLGQVQLTQPTPATALLGQGPTRTVTIPGPRGQILLADGTPLVTNAFTPVLTISPTVLADAPDGGTALLTRIADALGLTTAAVIGRTKVCGRSGAPPVPDCNSGSAVAPVAIVADPPMTKVLGLLEQPARYPGLALQQVPHRVYPATGSVNAAQLLGYVGSVDAADLKADSALTVADVIGRAGLESSYDQQLRGRPGTVTYAVDSRGLPTSVVSQTAAAQGDTIRTSLVAAVQRRTESALAGALTTAKAPAGAVVVLDASDGSVVAMSSQPSYDPSVWVGGISSAEYARITSGSNALADRAIAEVQPPGSTFKAFTLPGAINAGVDPAGSYPCTSSLQIGNRTFTNFDSESFGAISMTTALAVSCDTVFYRWAYDQWQKEGGLAAATTTTSPFEASARAFGLGRVTGIDLPGEAAGLIPDRAWKLAQWQQTKRAVCRRAQTGYPEVTDKARAAYLTEIAKENCAAGYQWQPGDAVNFVIGQGSVQTTPLQLAVAYGAIANGGTLWRPHVVHSVVDPSGTSTPIAPVRAGTVTLSAAARQTLSTGLCQVTASAAGTAHQAFRGFDLSSYKVCGKTGSAEVFGKKPTAWFISYGPRTASGHQYVVAVMVEQSGTGADVAAPVGRQIWDVLRTMD